MEKKRLVIIMAVLMTACHVFADKYKVLYVNSTGIKIETKNVAVGSGFTDKDKIVWTDDRQAMKVINLNTNRIIVLAAKALKKKKASSLYEYLTSTKHLSTRDLKRRKTMELWQVDSTLYLLDTLYISRPDIRGNDVGARIIDDKGKTIDLPMSNDGRFYVITRDMCGNQIFTPKRFAIKEFDRERNWEYIVYRNLIIEPILP
ncbi:MAG: hypothetical protein E7101_02120 [Prevotella ruminicola]|jgi:hypothetical protein|uniref:Lipoprotein n=1 Tax=Xylanibacter ruminicola TaxID=839 RepID=A0A9D5S8H6_XYLRU|nr:hypothetical protein [Xylanibacter ruminicola]